MLMHSVWFGESHMVQVPLLWTCLIQYGPVKDGCILSDNERMDFLSTCSLIL